MARLLTCDARKGHISSATRKFVISEVFLHFATSEHPKGRHRPKAPQGSNAASNADGKEARQRLGWIVERPRGLPTRGALTLLVPRPYDRAWLGADETGGSDTACVPHSVNPGVVQL